MNDRAAPRNQRVILTPKLAMEIYKVKLELLNPKDFHSWFHPSTRLLKGHSVPVARRYNVSAKTIRDIWNRKTWTFATSALWCQEKTDQLLYEPPVYDQARF